VLLTPQFVQPLNFNALILASFLSTPIQLHSLLATASAFPQQRYQDVCVYGRGALCICHIFIANYRCYPRRCKRQTTPRQRWQRLQKSMGILSQSNTIPDYHPLAKVCDATSLSSFPYFNMLSNCPQTTPIRPRQQTRYHAAHRPRPHPFLPAHSRNSNSARNMARPRLLPRRVSFRPARPLRSRVHTPLFAIFMAGSRTLYPRALRNRGHTIHRCGCDIA